MSESRASRALHRVVVQNGSCHRQSSRDREEQGHRGPGMGCTNSKTEILWIWAFFGGICMSCAGLWLNWRFELWIMSSWMIVMIPILQGLAAMIPSEIQNLFGNMRLPAFVVWAAFNVSAGVFSIACGLLAARRRRIFLHEPIGTVLILAAGALLGTAPQDEFLVLLPLSVSLMLLIARLSYRSSWDGTSTHGAESNMDEKSVIGKG